MTSNFYYKIPVIKEFDQLVDDSNFHTVPDNWSVVVTDIEGSTKAIAEGRYQDVNLVGASAIVALLDRTNEDLPYVFNGDGAAILVPTEQSSAVRETLSGLIALVQERFDLTLRAAIYPVHELINGSEGMDVARLELAKTRALAEFRGGALLRAEERLKQHPETLIPADPSKMELCSLNRLTCRWQAIPAQRGEVVSLLVLPQRHTDTELFGQIIDKVREIAGGTISLLNPVSIKHSSYKTIFRCLREEARLHPNLWTRAYFNRVVSILIAVPLFGWGLHKRIGWAHNYVANIDRHADYRKLDDTLRMVLDCSSEQIDQIEKYLSEQYLNGKVFYGLHRSRAAQITCYVESTDDGQHVHFVDGTEGGYATASIQLKAQIEQASEQTALSA